MRDTLVACFAYTSGTVVCFVSGRILAYAVQDVVDRRIDRSAFVLLVALAGLLLAGGLMLFLSGAEALR